MNITIKKGSDKPIYMQIKEQIQSMIVTKKIPPGYSLPPERKLAAMLGVNRSTVLKAYQELKADEFIESHIGKGTFVLQGGCEENLYTAKQINTISWYQFFNKRYAEMNESIISNIMDISSQSSMISFAGGIAAPEFYPIKQIEEIYKELLKKSAEEILQNTAVEGYYPLRESIGKLLMERGINVLTKDIMILSGSQQGLDYASRIFLDAGDTVIAEEPTYLGAIQIFRSYGVRVIGVPVDGQGICTDILESYLIRFKPKLIYTLPTYQNPTGIVMSMERRYKLLDLAYRYQIPVIEDDPYGELRYDGDFLPPLKALDKHGYVIYLSTFSKTLFMGFRVGWVAAYPEVISKFALLKQFTDLQANTPSQWVLDNFLRKGFYQSHLSRVLKEYKIKRDIMDEALRKFNPYDIQWHKPNGGFYIWCRLPDEIRQSVLIGKAAKKGVSYVPGEAFCSNGGVHRNYIRLNYTYASPEQIVEGIERLMEAVKESVGEGTGSTVEVGYNKRPLV